jgi:hypothetical protein
MGWRACDGSPQSEPHVAQRQNVERPARHQSGGEVGRRGRNNRVPGWLAGSAGDRQFERQGLFPRPLATRRLFMADGAASHDKGAIQGQRMSSSLDPLETERHRYLRPRLGSNRGVRTDLRFCEECHRHARREELEGRRIDSSPQDLGQRKGLRRR